MRKELNIILVEFTYRWRIRVIITLLLFHPKLYILFQ